MAFDQPSAFRLSDLFEHSILIASSSGKAKGKGKGKGKVSDPVTEVLDKGQREWIATLQEFKTLLVSLKGSTVADGSDEQPEYGHDLSFNVPSRAAYFEGFEESEDEEDVMAALKMAGVEAVPGFSEGFPKAVSREEKFDRDWLLHQCEIHGGYLTGQELCERVFTILRPGKTNDDIQADLMGLFGDNEFEFVSILLRNRKTIVDNIMEEFNASKRAYIPALAARVIPESKRPTFGPQVIIQSEAEVKELKSLRKEQKKARAAMRAQEDESLESSYILGFGGDSTALLRQAREEALRTARAAPLFSSTAKSSVIEEYPNVYQATQTGRLGVRYSQPQQTVQYKDYDEVTIPITKQAPVRVGEKRISVNDMDPLCSQTFKGYASMNRIQSIIYPIGYETSENMLVCAPTGSGKTDVALMTILRCLSQYCEPTPELGQNPTQQYNIATSEFKIVYVAPMKALAAEVVDKFRKKLKWLRIEVRELTGDMQLTKAEISRTQIIVTTPEKWDVVTRKSIGDVELAEKVKLLIVDEVHLLHDDRGAVLESLVARTLRQVESRQSLIRIVGLSATLPNYLDVADFLKVNPRKGLFYFDGGFRPVPLEQHFLGVKGKPNSQQYNDRLNAVCYDEVLKLVRERHQVMVFVHARKETVKTAMMLKERASEDNELSFAPTEHPRYGLFQKEVAKSQNRELREMFPYGFGIHHAGMLRSDRSMTERLFADGLLSVLCCTATLAWGVNLPAYAVVIKGTQIYDTQKGSFVDLTILDVMQIFGRAGRPQFENQGVGFILTTHDKLAHYVSAMTQQLPIESKFVGHIADNLNAEISLGTVTNVDDAVQWLGYTYLFVRMKKNPTVYGMNHTDPAEDPLLGQKRRDLVISAARSLARNQMIIFDENTGYLTPKDLGRIASNFYIRHKSIATFNEEMKVRMTEADVLAMISKSSEFDDLKARDSESRELGVLQSRACACAIKHNDKGKLDFSSTEIKVNILLQSHISKVRPEDFALISDCAYVAQNAARIVRALFEIALNRSWGPVTSVLLSLNKAIDRQMWTFEHPIAQFGKIIPFDIIQKLESRSHTTTMEEMRDMTPAELGQLVRHVRLGSTIAKCVDQFPTLKLEVRIAPVTRNVLSIELDVIPDFEWYDHVHGSSEPWWIWAEDSENTDIYYSEYFVLTKKQYGETTKIVFTVPLVEPLPAQIYIRAVSDRWLGAETVVPVSFQHLILPELYPPHTDLLDLHPLPISALHDEVLEEICGKRFSHFNPVQTQIFHTLYHTDYNALIGAPTGSGKTVAAELAMWWAFKKHPGSKVVYIAPMKALVRERVSDWRKRLTGPMNKQLVELTGDVTPDMRTIETADIIITTPEKWDGISRSWQTRSYVRQVSCVIIDEIHLLGGDRGPILEVIVSRMNYIGSQLDRKVRIVGLSTALANARDLADWLGIEEVGLFNFRHSVRPVPLEIYIDGFPGKAYCPRMATMNKPTFAAIKTHSPSQPVIVFVSSRRQTRLTAQDLITYCGMEDNPRQWLKIPDDELDMIVSRIRDEALQYSLPFGIGLHHAGLTESDRKVVEELFVNQKIQILIATSTLAWGVNFPAHLVVLKGTEFYNNKISRYTDYPITDVLQMMGRAGRPQFDTTGVARIFVHDSKKNFYKKFLHEPFPVESSLHKYLDDHIMAEIVSGTLKSKQDVMDYLTWTYFYRRLQQNPTYYGLEEVKPSSVELFLSKMIDGVVNKLVESGCVQIVDDFELEPTTSGHIASYYYLHHNTVRHYRTTINKRSTFEDLLNILSDVPEYEELPVRHNEDVINRQMETTLPFPVRGIHDYGSAHVKAFVLLQAYFSRLPKMPIADYITDQITVLDSSIRFLQAMVDVAADSGMLRSSLNVMNLLQCIKQARWPEDSSLTTLPHIEKDMVGSIVHKGVSVNRLDELTSLSDTELKKVFSNVKQLSQPKIQEICKVIAGLPILQVTHRIDTVKHYLIPDATYTLHVSMQQSSRVKGQDGRVHAPKFPKPQYESWWVVLGNPATDELVALKRMSMRNGPNESVTSKTNFKLEFVAPQGLGRHRWVLYVVSDGYLGLDRQEEIEFEVRTDLDV